MIKHIKKTIQTNRVNNINTILDEVIVRYRKEKLPTNDINKVKNYLHRNQRDTKEYIIIKYIHKEIKKLKIDVKTVTKARQLKTSVRKLNKIIKEKDNMCKFLKRKKKLTNEEQMMQVIEESLGKVIDLTEESNDLIKEGKKLKKNSPEYKMVAASYDSNQMKLKAAFSNFNLLINQQNKLSYANIVEERKQQLDLAEKLVTIPFGMAIEQDEINKQREQEIKEQDKIFMKKKEEVLGSDTAQSDTSALDAAIAEDEFDASLDKVGQITKSTKVKD